MGRVIEMSSEKYGVIRVVRIKTQAEYLVYGVPKH